MKIMLVSAATPDYKSLQDISSVSFHDYAFLNGYGYDIKIIYDKERPASWYKIPAILDNFQKGCDFVFWIDCDAIIINKKIKLESFIEDGKDFYYSFDLFGMNCGVMLFRNTAEVKNLLYTAWAQNHLINHPWWEQAALRAIVDGGMFPFKKIKEIPASIFNSYEYWGGCLVYHLPEHPLYERIRQFKKIVSKI
jgi:hypothetical protein